MKIKYTIFILFFTLNTFIYSQFDVKNSGNLISSGHVFNFTSNVYPSCKLNLQLTNTSSSNHEYLIKVENLINNDGSMFQICLNVCYSGIQIGDTYPNRNDGILSLNAGASTSTDGIYLMNVDNVGTIFPMDYVFKIYETDGFGGELGTPFYFTYRYDPNTASVSSLKEKTMVSPTLATDVVNVISDVKIKTTLMDMQGRLLQTNDAVINPVINVAELVPQTYLLICEDEQGNQFTQKIVKQ